MRAMLCDCSRRLEAADEESLARELVAHMSREHEREKFDGARAREIVEARSYRYEYIGEAVNDAETEEVFGAEPY